MRLFEWQPIETAPKDGHPILLGIAGPENTYPEKAWWDTRHDKWTMWVTSNNIRIVIDTEPTHWAELPDVPIIRNAFAPSAEQQTK